MATLTAEILRTIYNYDPVAGVVYYCRRPRDHFVTQEGQRIFNRTKAGKPVPHHGESLWEISHAGNVFHMSPGQTLWMLAYGVSPSGRIAFIDGDPGNLRLANLCEETADESGQPSAAQWETQGLTPEAVSENKPERDGDAPPRRRRDPNRVFLALLRRHHPEEALPKRARARGGPPLYVPVGSADWQTLGGVSWDDL